MVSAQTRLFLIAFFIVSLCVPFVSAVQYFSIAQPDTLTQKDVFLYYANGTLQGMYNTTSSGIAVPNDTDGDFMLVIKPQYGTPLDEPATFLASLMSWGETNALALIILAIVIGLAFRKW